MNSRSTPGGIFRNHLEDQFTGFNYDGLIVVTGNTTFVGGNSAAVNPQIHGALIVGGTFSRAVGRQVTRVPLAGRRACATHHHRRTWGRFRRFPENLSSTSYVIFVVWYSDYHGPTSLICIPMLTT